jgi:hypothetical protein
VLEEKVVEEQEKIKSVYEASKNKLWDSKF